MITIGMTFVYPDGETGTVTAGRDSLWNIEKECGVTTWGVETAEVERLIALHDRLAAVGAVKVAMQAKPPRKPRKVAAAVAAPVIVPTDNSPK